MKTKVCSCCKKELPLSEFHLRLASRDGYRHKCKKCCIKYLREYRKRPHVKELERIMAIKFRNKKIEIENNKINDIIGGYKIAILNYVKDGEKNFVIQSTLGELFAANSKKEFMAYLGNI